MSANIRLGPNAKRFTGRNSSTAVIFVMWMARIEAARHHGAPRTIFRRPRHPVFSGSGYWPVLWVDSRKILFCLVRNAYLSTHRRGRRSHKARPLSVPPHKRGRQAAETLPGQINSALCGTRLAGFDRFGDL